uniref:Uncharacterized protein n=1 Tax=Nelumbo nucifera TaxID=4432 RepID=A0A822YF98_NELNU|nr:TPA_asm: hypothetical protein HUJ06_031154 [Nelumbo nucifera]
MASYNPFSARMGPSPPPEQSILPASGNGSNVGERARARAKEREREKAHGIRHGEITKLGDQTKYRRPPVRLRME